MNKKNITKVFITLTLILCFIGTGYAILTQTLRINGTTQISGIWSVKITNIKSITRGSASNKSLPSFNGTTASFDTYLKEPGDKVTYTITVKNNGTIDAVVENISLSKSSNPDILFYYEGIDTGNVLKSDEEQEFLVVVEYNQNAALVNKAIENVTISINYIQASKSTIAFTDKVNIFKPQDLRNKKVSYGDGLYEDTSELGRYIFKGLNPDNYIKFNKELWRILSIETDGTMKIVKKDALSNMSWDDIDTRKSDTDTYCLKAANYGCNAWAKTNKLLDTISGNTQTEFKLYYPNGNTNDTKVVSGTVTKDASLNTYLNGTYYNALTADKNYIATHAFNVGTAGFNSDTETMKLNVQEEKYYAWTGKVGLITITEYMRTTTDSSCKTLNDAYSTTDCGTNNWLKLDSSYWTLTPCVYLTRYSVWSVNSNGNIEDNNANSYQSIIPTVYLSSDIKLKGTGTITDYYTIIG